MNIKMNLYLLRFAMNVQFIFCLSHIYESFVFTNFSLCYYKQNKSMRTADRTDLIITTNIKQIILQDT